jgi:hypothetical protein
MTISLIEYATEDRIVDLIAKERAKVAVKHKLKGKDPESIYHETTPEDYVAELFLITPSRNTWKRPVQKDRKVKSTGKTKTTKAINSLSIAKTIRRDKINYERMLSAGDDVKTRRYKYLGRLDAFIKDILTELASSDKFEFKSMTVFPKFKKFKEGKRIMRPICCFASLKEKLLLSILSTYLTRTFDGSLHPEILSYRPKREYQHKWVITDRNNAVANIQDFRKARIKEGKAIYVAECDIRKFFDTINHDVVRESFKMLCEEKRYAGVDMGPANRLLEAYLKCYSFYNNVADCKLPDNEKFEVPDTMDFVRLGCYDEDSFIGQDGDIAQSYKDKIGIPQGGAISGFIANMILNRVDRESGIYNPDDKDLLFCRYCDDTILMHADKSKCEALIGAYARKLAEYQFQYHEFQDISADDYKSNWDKKSLNTFLWGRNTSGEPSMDWIGFLGYEIRYTGEIRLRRSSLDDKMKSIKRTYFNIARKKYLTKGTEKKPNKLPADDIVKEGLKDIQRFDKNDLENAVSLTNNKYSASQAHKLDNYRVLQIRKATCKIAARYNEKAGSSNVRDKILGAAEDFRKKDFNFLKTLEGHDIS